MANDISSRTPTEAFESTIACRNDPAPESFVFVTDSTAKRFRPSSVSMLGQGRFFCWFWRGIVLLSSVAEKLFGKTGLVS